MNAAQHVFICSTLHRINAVSPVYTVLIDGEVYSNVNKYLLAALHDGMTPAELEMEADEGEGEKLIRAYDANYRLSR